MQLMPSPDTMCPSSVTIKLSALDQIKPRAYTPFPLIFAIEPSMFTEALSVLSQGFERLLSDFAILSGYIVSASRKGEVEVRVSGSTRPELLVRDFLEENGDFKLKFLPAGGKTFDDVPAPVFAAQANKMKVGIVLCICVHHSVMDGMGMAAVIRRWAEWCRAISTHTDLASLEKACLSRSPVISGGRRNRRVDISSSYASGDIAAEERRQRKSTQVSERPEMIGKCFMTNKVDIAMLKDAIMAFLGGDDPHGAWVSTNDVLCAVLWHAIVRARSGEGPVVECKRSKLGVPVNVRSKMVPPLPQDFIGNATVDVTVDRPMTELLIWSTPKLARTALSIRQAILSVDDAYIRALIDTIDGLEDIRRSKGGCESFLGDDVTITSWLDMGICNLDWGEMLGMIEERTQGFDGFDGLCIILPRRRDGSVKIMVGLEASCMKRLEKDGDLATCMRIIET